MLFEAQLASPTPSAYRQHQYLEGLFAQLSNDPTVRPYTWSALDGTLHVRRTLPTDELMWLPVDIPKPYSKITFHLSARVRCDYTERRRGARPTNTDPIKNRNWLDRCAERIGLRIIDCEVELTEIWVDKRSKKRRNGFPLQACNFMGVANVLDADLFERGLTIGLGDSKAFGLGYLFFWERGSDGT